MSSRGRCRSDFARSIINFEGRGGREGGEGRGKGKEEEGKGKTQWKEGGGEGRKGRRGRRGGEEGGRGKEKKQDKGRRRVKEGRSEKVEIERERNSTRNNSLHESVKL